MLKKYITQDKAFAALKNDGTVFVWGDTDYGGTFTSGNEIFRKLYPLTNVKEIYSTSKAFAALKNDNTVSIWGDFFFWETRVLKQDTNSVFGLNNVKKIYSTRGAFAALKYDGTVFVWGYSDYGGNNDDVSSLTNVKNIYLIEHLLL